MMMMMMQRSAGPLICFLFLCLQVHPTCAFSASHRHAFHVADGRSSPPLFATTDGPASASSTGVESSKSKRIVLIRHGTTFMNEQLSIPGSRWGDANFTDIFDPSSDTYNLFRDSPLSERGIRQAQRLSSRLGHLLEGGRAGADIDFSLDLMQELDIIAVSPLTRALQTAEIALLPHINPVISIDPSPDDVVRDDYLIPPSKRRVPVVALPLASERVYLISDMGRPAHELSKQYPYVDFDCMNSKNEEWWFTTNNNDQNNYVEWRPNGEGQTYACLGEPEVEFNRRMAGLYDWLAERDEQTIALVCHWGVIDWLIGEDFENCEIRMVEFESMRRTGFMISDEEAANVFAQGERCVVRDED